MASLSFTSVTPPLLVLLSCLLSVAHAVTCYQKDKTALLEFKKSLNNPYHLASWDPNTDCCDWYCVTCDVDTGRVSELAIFAGNVTGTIPDSIGELTALTELTLRKLDLYGEISPKIGLLRNLTSLRLDWNRFSGQVPEWLSELNRLTFLDLAFNQFSGNIPATLSQLPNLVALHLDRNQLSGEIPASFGGFRGKTPSLYLSHNRLSGLVPKSLGSIDFDVIDISRNLLEGDVSHLFGATKSTFSIDISRNKFVFDFGKVEVPTGLGVLDMNHNAIYGEIPKSIVGLGMFQSFNASYNRLCGAIPQGGEMKRFDASSYIHNKCLCGSPLPACT
ncbi:hypothetical protein AMTRI_Chr03g139090 [Amborella trichopoda]|uniref:Leucine-rich repeat-containing N-terminal plant-type domain-containing protein n=1 Tax=Amborella trichopoda TaxID=13333 RepID=W1PNU7_AMBTC|nr:polygalacturonase inhibitor 1 [Amborella trichopoda]ERN11672.1 hypothetical protein AMTR_s00022p00220000 [Amborella trichopoda]|eukprot:XP_006850091.1 polygalacturonase inhibitor 1 [Amborella trichopoda]